MNKNLGAFSIIFLGICIVTSSLIISQSLKTTQHEQQQDKYEFITIASDYFIIFDKQTGEYWRNIGGSGWEKKEGFKLPIYD